MNHTAPSPTAQALEHSHTHAHTHAHAHTNTHTHAQTHKRPSQQAARGVDARLQPPQLVRAGRNGQRERARDDVAPAVDGRGAAHGALEALEQRVGVEGEQLALRGLRRPRTFLVSNLFSSTEACDDRAHFLFANVFQVPRPAATARNGVYIPSSDRAPSFVSSKR